MQPHLRHFLSSMPRAIFMESWRGFGRQILDNVWSLRHRLFQSDLMFFQFRESENTTPMLTNSQTALNSRGVTVEARVGSTIRLNVGEQGLDQSSFPISK